MFSFKNKLPNFKLKITKNATLYESLYFDEDISKK
jgi:hypothetical protein